MNKLILRFLCAIICITVIWTGCEKKSSEEIFSDIIVDADTLIFSGTCVGNSIDGEITISNSGNRDLEINSLTIGGTNHDEFSHTRNCLILKNGEICILELTFAPKKIGDRTASLLIRSNANNNPELSIPLDGKGLPQPGVWEGDDIQFYVSEDGNKLTTAGSTLRDSVSLIVTARGSTSCGGYTVLTRYYHSEISINNFEFTTSDNDITGIFLEDNICVVSGSLDGSIVIPFAGPFNTHLTCWYSFDISSLQAEPQKLKSSIISNYKDETIVEFYPDGKTKTRLMIIE